MPAPPELGDGGGGVRVAEVLRGGEAEHGGKTDGHVAVTGEIEVDLHEAGQSAQPAGADVPAAPQGEHLARHCRGGGGEEDLLGKADDKPPQAQGQLPGARLPGGKLGGEPAEAGDGPRRHLREKGHIQQNIQKGPGRPAGPPAYIHHVGDALEGKEGDAQGQRPAQKRQLLTQQIAQGEGEEVQIFEGSQDGQMAGDGSGQSGAGPPGPGSQQAGQIGHQGGQKKQRQSPELAEGVEHQPGQGQKQIFPPDAGDEPVEQHGGGEEKEEEGG